MIEVDDLLYTVDDFFSGDEFFPLTNFSLLTGHFLNIITKRI